MYCPKCGAKLTKDSVFCHNCGSKLPKELTETVEMQLDDDYDTLFVDTKDKSKTDDTADFFKFGVPETEAPLISDSGFEIPDDWESLREPIKFAPLNDDTSEDDLNFKIPEDWNI